MMMITSIDSYIQTVSNVPALLQNKEFLENLHPRYTEVLARSNNAPNAATAAAANNAGAAAAGGGAPSPAPPTSPLDSAIQTLLETGLQPDTNVNRHSIGVVGLLCAKTRTQEFNTNFEGFLVQVSGFMEVADWGQLRLVAGVVTEIASAITDQMIRRTQPILGINLLGNIARSLQAHDKMLTSVHACVLQLCCASYNFKAGLAYIIDDFEEFTGDLKSSDNTSYLLTYLYYSGLIHTALKSYDSAIYFFEACTRVPAITLSHIMLESYKKLLLVSLIHLGEVPPPHKSSAQVVNRVLKPSALQYTELATSFAIGSDSLSNCIAKNLDGYRRDGNMGLVKQVKSAHMRVLIRKLTRTFLTLSLEDVGRRAVVCGGGNNNNNGNGNGVAAAAADGREFMMEAERVVLGMIEDSSVYAKINQKDGMVRFLDEGVGGGNNNRNGGSASSLTSSSVLDLLEGKLNSCIELNRRINTMNERISTNPEFISKVVVSMDSSGGGNASAGGSGTSLGGGGHGGDSLMSGGGSSSSSNTNTTTASAAAASTTTTNANAAAVAAVSAAADQGGSGSGLISSSGGGSGGRGRGGSSSGGGGGGSGSSNSGISSSSGGGSNSNV